MREFFLRVGFVLALVSLSVFANAQDPSSDPAEVVDEVNDSAEAESLGDVVASDPSADVNYDLRLRELEDRVNDLKEEIFRSKSRLFLLRQQILQDNIGGSRVLITHNNLMSSRYRPVQVLYSLDGDIVYTANAADGEIPDNVEVFNASILPGPHNLSVRIVFEGHGYGIVSYMSDCSFELMNSRAFNVDEGQTVILDVVSFEEGGINQPIEERPRIRFDERSISTIGDVAAE